MMTAGQVALAMRAIRDHEKAAGALRRFREWAGTSPEAVPVEIRVGDGNAALDRLRAEVPRDVIEQELVRQALAIEAELRALNIEFQPVDTGSGGNLVALPLRRGPI